MKSMRRWLFVAGSLALLVSTARADVLTLSPVKTAVLPDDGSGLTRMALQFDLSGIRQGEGRRIDNAILEWEVGDNTRTETGAFSVQEIANPWDPQSITEGVTAPTVQSKIMDRWHITPWLREHRGGLVRLDLQEVANRWMSGASGNFGVLVTTPMLTQASGAQLISNARLVVYYGFFIPEKK